MKSIRRVLLLLLGFLFWLSILPVTEVRAEAVMNPYRELKVPITIEKYAGYYFVTDAYHNQVIYTNDLRTPISQWKVMAGGLAQPHGISYDGKNYVVLDTEENRIKVYEKRGERFACVQTLEDIGIRPHDIEYVPQEKAFYIWSSMTGDMYIVKRDASGRYFVDQMHHVKGLEEQYVRSFYFLGDYIFFPSGTNGKMLLVDKQDYNVVAAFPVVDDIAGMVDIRLIGEYYYITVSTDLYGDQSKAAIIRTKNPAELSLGIYEDVTSLFPKMDGPYAFTQIGGDYYLTSTGPHGLYRFAGSRDKLYHIEVVY